MDVDGEIAAAQFAGGMSIAQVAREWDREAQWVESSIRQALLNYIPRRDGGLKATRTELRAMRSEEVQAARETQQKLEW